ncbi:GntR family transcriptional regulator [Xanthobacter oligotrophicus]|uniref:GntR family transcriptional regulator n=1 Tax=Xanthobacter oligotrophicus TaxID=2607286 RepID=UPI0011F15403|nr:GntR family transcriptional regulator [Xanthobacter oligotrophicus]MCG5234171.1 GntR family transcriptional regulator [Xanthobacter oligotrophicus]
MTLLPPQPLKAPASAPRPRRRRAAGRPVTRTEELRLQIADDIVRGRLAPGTPLEEVEIAKRYGVSRTPVREALRDLAASGLVEARPHRSALVAQPSLERLRGMFDVMAELEALCAGLCAVHMTAAERVGLEATHAELADLTRRGDEGGYTVLNERFHTTLYAGSHNDYLAELTLATRARLQPFRRAQFRTLGRLARSYEEHDRVVTAILRGDKAEAAAAMRAHILTVEVAYERYAESV